MLLACFEGEGGRKREIEVKGAIVIEFMAATAEEEVSMAKKLICMNGNILQKKRPLGSNQHRVTCLS